MAKDIENVIIIGSGPAGLTSAIYTSRANLEPLMIEGEEAGGQLMTTTDVENYPGYPEGIMGPEMMALFRKQAERFGTRFITKNVTRVDFSQRPFKLWIGNEEYKAKSIIISTGA
ncbi:MAG: FAD-dependent oxidoreductase, partial [Bdellovibrionales bacterium]|nr:FAD-dependent oxidoreductase [Bdellovibrionales bacterium]